MSLSINNEDKKLEQELQLIQKTEAENIKNALKNTTNQKETKFVFLQDYESQPFCADEIKSNNSGVGVKEKCKLFSTFNFKKGDVISGYLDTSLKDGSKLYYTKNGKTVAIQNLGILEKVDEKVVSNESFLQKHKNHLLIAGALVLGYLAYKKFNK
jgi:hypothetical protein